MRREKKGRKKRIKVHKLRKLLSRIAVTAYMHKFRQARKKYMLDLDRVLYCKNVN